MYDATPISYEDYSPDDKPLVALIKTKDLWGNTSAHTHTHTAYTQPLFQPLKWANPFSIYFQRIGLKNEKIIWNWYILPLQTMKLLINIRHKGCCTELV